LNTCPQVIIGGKDLAGCLRLVWTRRTVGMPPSAWFYSRNKNNDLQGLVNTNAV